MRNIFVITFKNGIPVNFDQISKGVHDAGFFVSSLRVTFNFDNVKVAGNHFSYDGDTFELVNNNGNSLSGPVAVTIIDKGFAPRSVSKKYLGQVAVTSTEKPGRLYHVAI